MMARLADVDPAVLEGEPLLWLGLFALGLLGLLLAQPLGRPKPDLATRLRRLQVDERRVLAEEAERAARPVPAGSAFGALLRPMIERAGATLLATLDRLGIRGGEDLRRDLAVLRPGTDLATFYGEKIVTGLLALVLFPATTLVSGGALAWPLWAGLAGALAGYQLPSWLLRRRMARLGAQVVLELPIVIDLLTVCFSAGRAVEPAVRIIAAERGGLVAGEFRRCLRDMAVNHSSLLAELGAAAERLRSPDLAALARQLEVSDRNGLEAARALAVQAESLRERKRLQIVEEGAAASVKMLFPVGLLILPALFLIVLYPALVEFRVLTR